jgi:hypothetical protein
MTKTELKTQIIAQQLRSDLENQLLKRVDNYQQEELSDSDLQDFNSCVEKAMAHADAELAAIQEDKEILEDMYAQIDQIEEEYAQQVTQVYQDGIEQIGELVNQIKK